MDVFRVFCLFGVLAFVPAPLWAADENLDKGREALQKKDYDTALARLSDAIQSDPQNAVAYSLRAYAYLQKKDLDKALADLSEAIRLNPDDIGAYGNRSMIYVLKRDLDKAIEDLGETIRLDPQNAARYIGRSAVYAQKKDYDKAIEASNPTNLSLTPIAALSTR